MDFSTWVIKVYNACDVILFATARFINLSYEETVVVVWCIVWPLYTILITVHWAYLIGKVKALPSHET
jgi:hypothetical protein